METFATLTALAEPNRLRIIELLRVRPRTVGEISDTLRLRQPQVTKHLQTLEKAGLVLIYPLGQRRVYALTAAPLQQLQQWINSFEPNWKNPPHDLEAYVQAVKRETALAAKNSSWADGRTVIIKRIFMAPRKLLWRYWTREADMEKWWSPDYLTTVGAVSDPRPNGTIRIDMQSPDGDIHTAAGHYKQLRPYEQIDFVMSPLDANGKSLFESHDTITFTEIDKRTTEVTLRVQLEASTAAAVTYIAGLEIGWNQTLDKLARVLATAEGSETPM